LLVFGARVFLPTRWQKVRERLLTTSEEEAFGAGHYSARCPRCGREKLYDMETDERIYRENAFEYAGRQVFCGRCYFEGPLEPIK
jgi:phage terminase large subunit GpA-like protein